MFLLALKKQTKKKLNHIEEHIHLVSRQATHRSDFGGTLTSAANIFFEVMLNTCIIHFSLQVTV